MYLYLKKGTFIPFFFTAILFAGGYLFANTEPNSEKSNNSKNSNREYASNQVPSTYSTDSLEVANKSKGKPETEENNLKTEGTTENAGNNDFYDEEEGLDETQSFISFNFLYYLLEKFKFSNSLRY